MPDGTFTAGNGVSPRQPAASWWWPASSEKIVAVDASLGGGLYAGIAGAVSVENIDSDTIASLADGAQINQSTASSAGGLQTVVVAATNNLNILTYAGGLGVGAGGVGASADIGVLHNDTQALVGSAAVRAKQESDVFALSRWDVNSNAISAGAGAGGLGGGIVVYSIGGDFSDTYSTDGGNGSALKGKNSTVLDFVNDTVGTLTGRANTNDPSPPAFDPSQKVDEPATPSISAPTVASRPATPWCTESGGGTAINGLEDGKAYFVIVDSAHPTKVRLAASYDEAQAGHAIAITKAGATGTNHRSRVGNAAIANLGRSHGDSRRHDPTRSAPPA